FKKRRNQNDPNYPTHVELLEFLNMEFIIHNIFWGIVDFVINFFKSLLQQDVKINGYINSPVSWYNEGRKSLENPHLNG
uniref:Uncharacterized protein n=1 Tax=Monodelphis domestica TaxID=13616 RepID=A0A5F8H1C3_MONDO